MKNLKLTLGLVALATAFTSCKDENQEMAKNSVDSYESYVDSISNVTEAEAAANWDAIQADYERMKMDIEGVKTVITKVKDVYKSITDYIMTFDVDGDGTLDENEKDALQKDLDNASMKYDEYKVKVVTEKQRMDGENSKTMMYQSFFGDAYVSDDMKFNWVNKDNILSVYENFYNTVEKNKDAYTREQWDEIKLTYEALDTRKNTVEQEGLSSEDNRKIAGIKIKFAPMYTVNRMGSKSQENSDAKK